MPAGITFQGYESNSEIQSLKFKNIAWIKIRNAIIGHLHHKTRVGEGVMRFSNYYNSFDLVSGPFPAIRTDKENYKNKSKLCKF